MQFYFEYIFQLLGFSDDYFEFCPLPAADLQCPFQLADQKGYKTKSEPRLCFFHDLFGKNIPVITVDERKGVVCNPET